MKTTCSLQPKADVASVVSTWLRSDNRPLSSLMEDKVTNQSALLITHAVLSLICLLLFAPFSIPAAIVSLSWFILSLLLCTKGGLK